MLAQRIYQKYRHNTPCAAPPTTTTNAPNGDHAFTHTDNHRVSVARARRTKCMDAEREEHLCANGRYTSSFSPIILILFFFYSQILCPILAAINDKCYDTIKPSRLHITAAIKAMILSTTSIRCALVIPASCYSARTRIPNQNVFPLLHRSLGLGMCACVRAARIQQERRAPHTCNGNTVACAVRCRIPGAKHSFH